MLVPNVNTTNSRGVNADENNSKNLKEGKKKKRMTVFYASCTGTNYVLLSVNLSILNILGVDTHESRQQAFHLSGDKKVELSNFAQNKSSWGRVPWCTCSKGVKETGIAGPQAKKLILHFLPISQAVFVIKISPLTTDAEPRAKKVLALDEAQKAKKLKMFEKNPKFITLIWITAS